MNRRRVFAWTAIVLLGGMYLACLILALIGSETAQFLLKVAVVCTMVVPLILYGFLVLTKANRRSGLREELPADGEAGPEGEAATEEAETEEPAAEPSETEKEAASQAEKTEDR